jgi:hypothetical protein
MHDVHIRKKLSEQQTSFMMEIPTRIIFSIKTKDEYAYL